MRKTIWHRVRVPIVWRPKAPNAELIGVYRGSRQPRAVNGTYLIHFVELDSGAVRYVSGTIANDLFSLVEAGSRVKLVYKGTQIAQPSGHEYKRFELFTEKEIELKVAV